MVGGGALVNAIPYWPNELEKIALPLWISTDKRCVVLISFLFYYCPISCAWTRYWD